MYKYSGHSVKQPPCYYYDNLIQVRSDSNPNFCISVKYIPVTYIYPQGNRYKAIPLYQEVDIFFLFYLIFDLVVCRFSDANLARSLQLRHSDPPCPEAVLW